MEVAEADERASPTRRWVPPLALALLVVSAFALSSLADGSDQSASPPGTGGRSSDHDVRDRADALLAWKKYKEAILAADGAAVPDLVSGATVDYYGDLVDVAVNADEAALRELPTLDVVVVLVSRYEFDAAELRRFDGRDLLAAAVDSGLISENTVADTEFEHVDLHGDLATLVATTSGQALRRLDLRREDGTWRIHLIPVIREASRRVDREVEAAGDSRVQTALSMVQAGRPDAGVELLQLPVSTDGAPESGLGRRRRSSMTAPVEIAATKVRHAPTAEFTIVAGAGHGFFRDRPKTFRASAPAP